MCCASDALPPLPNTRSFPPAFSASDIAWAASSVDPGCARTRSCSAMVAANAFSAIRDPSPAGTLIPLRLVAAGLHVRREFLGRELHRLVHLRFHVDLDRVVLPRGMALPVVRH